MITTLVEPAYLHLLTEYPRIHEIRTYSTLLSFLLTQNDV